MIALGAVLGVSNSFYSNLQNFALFFFIFFIVGAFYGIFCSVFLCLRDFKKFKKEFVRQLKNNKKTVFYVMLLGLVLMTFGFFENLLFMLGILIFISPYFLVYAKSVERAVMVKKVNVKKLVEGDWLCKNLKVKGRTVKANWDGLSIEEIKLIQKKYKFVEVKQGIPFIPVFLISFLIWIFLLRNSYW